MNEILLQLGLKRFIVTLLITLVVTAGSALVGWTYSQVRDMPQNYVTKTELEAVVNKLCLEMRTSLAESKIEVQREVQRMREDFHTTNQRLDSVINLLLQQRRSELSVKDG